MKFSELKPGMVVEYASGDKRFVIMFNGELIFTGKTGYQIDVSKWYNEDLTHKDYAPYNIVKVYEADPGTFDILIQPSKLLWEKSQIIELTIEQIAKKFDVEPNQIRIKK